MISFRIVGYPAEKQTLSSWKVIEATTAYVQCVSASPREISGTNFKDPLITGIDIYVRRV
jgi:hypothetical protein